MPVCVPPRVSRCSATVPLRLPSPMRSGIVTVTTRSWMTSSRPARCGDVGVLARRWVFGEVWARTELSRRDRSLAVLAILTSLGALPELAVHVPAGLRNGLSREEVEAAITHLTLYAGLPRAQEAMRTARDALDQ